MKKYAKMIRWFTISLVAFFLILISVLGCVFSRMQPTETGRINDDIYAGKIGYVNFFVYDRDSTTICFDAGTKPEAVAKEMENMGIDPAGVTHVFLTHSDKDHAGGISLFTHATIYLPENEVQMINGTTKRKFMFAKRNNKLPVQDFTTITDRQILQLGSAKIQAFNAPGHTPGSMVYLLNDSILITGDAFITDKTGQFKPFPKYINNDQKLAIKTITDLEKLEASLILTAHSGIYRR